MSKQLFKALLEAALYADPDHRAQHSLGGSLQK